VAHIDRDYDYFSKFFIIANAGNSGGIAECTEKRTLYDLASKHGLRIAKSWDLKNGVIPNTIEYPVITKPKRSYPGWKDDYFVCFSENDLKNALDKIGSHPVFAQQYIEKINELCLDGASINKGRNVLVAIASKYTYIVPKAFSNEMIITNFTDEALQESLERLLKDIGYEGLFSVEFLIDSNNDLWFLEVNFRATTWLYAATCLGMNLPLLWAEGMLEGSFPEGAVKEIPDGYIAISEIQDFWLRVKQYKMLSVRQWLKAVRRADCYFIYSRKDLKPWKSAWGFRIKSFLKKRISHS